MVSGMCSVALINFGRSKRRLAFLRGVPASSISPAKLAGAGHFAGKRKWQQQQHTAHGSEHRLLIVASSESEAKRTHIVLQIALLHLLLLRFPSLLVSLFSLFSLPPSLSLGALKGRCQHAARVKGQLKAGQS